MQQVQKYKKTELGEIPEEWHIRKLIDLGEIIGGGTPDTTKKDYWENGNIAWAVPTDLTDLKTNYIDTTDRYITKKGLDNSAAKLLPVGTVLITSRATIGECAISIIPITTNQGFQSIISNPENDNVFLLYLIKFNKAKLIRKSHGTTFLEISKNNIKNLKFSIPPLKEQQKIASILSNVDSLIQKTDQIIEQTQILKKGLMQRLLTKGIGHTKFKKTKLGSIPESWMVSNIGLLAELFVPMRDKPKEFDGNIPWLRIEDLDKKFATDSKSNQRVSKETVKKMNLRIYPVGTVLCSCSATIGVCAITTQELITNQTFIGIYPKPQLNNEFLYYYLSTQKNSLIKIGSGSTIPYISREKFESFPIVLPEIKEQQKIASILSNVDELIQKHQENKTNLETLKKGLMQQLLTGKIRVKV